MSLLVGNREFRTVRADDAWFSISRLPQILSLGLILDREVKTILTISHLRGILGCHRRMGIVRILLLGDFDVTSRIDSPDR
jgi:hypothetical protein